MVKNKKEEQNTAPFARGKSTETPPSTETTQEEKDREGEREGREGWVQGEGLSWEEHRESDVERQRKREGVRGTGGWGKGGSQTAQWSASSR